MQRVSRSLLIVLALLGLGVVVRARLAPRRISVLSPGTLRDLPYQIGPFSGKDVSGRDAEEVRASYRPAEIILRDYTEENRKPIELCIAPVPFGLKGPLVCVRYDGGVLTYAEELLLPGTPPVRAREAVVSVPWPDRPPENFACIYYWRQAQSGGYASVAGGILHDRINRLFGAEEDAFLIRFTTELAGQNQADALARLRHFALAADPIIVKSLQTSGSRSKEKSN